MADYAQMNHIFFWGKILDLYKTLILKHQHPYGVYKKKNTNFSMNEMSNMYNASEISHTKN